MEAMCSYSIYRTFVHACACVCVCMSACLSSPIDAGGGADTYKRLIVLLQGLIHRVVFF